ncbi:AfsR/SARP family transcriptional regulator [Streptomyces sp. TG1A-8]|uniref:AfsR/SARP family transcriptional regulator n=1 Tax=Streptomyces sp. TG1A-8 TaxID=3051385 RepID=UPI00265BD1F1|nr:AfsR/SARP family transcriptional regulator [Streptomyces sp. TG1A-8]MDO0924372.1 AfsR/SARP family transcriptional regulator [Streptomyces sp. TG1A-8]
MLTWHVLGTVRMTPGGHDLTPTAPKVRQTLALLLARRNTFVPVTAFVEELWPERPPRSATGVVQTYAYQLRKTLQGDGRGPADGGPLITRPQGYLLNVEHGECDAAEFTTLTTKGRAALAAGDHATAADLLGRALALWDGPPFADVPQGPALQGHALLLEELHLQARELRIEADLRLGRHRQLVGELKELACAHPLHEWFQGTLIIALQRCGRRSEALQVYQRLRERLRDELGLDPSPGLQRIRQHVLTDQISLADLGLLPR